jgi:cholesterol oxidase
MSAFDYDVVIVGSGFGGSAAALRLVEKGYRVLMLEKGRELGPDTFPKSNWNIKRYWWIPWLGCRGLFKMTFFRHVTIVSGVGVGGGSLVYACTHPEPKNEFFESGSWAHLADWKQELAPHYAEAKRMLGVTPTPILTTTDEALRATAVERGRADAFHPTDVAVWFGEPGKTVPDPFFNGRGPSRTGCIYCGGCMLGCRHGAKNTLDTNYLWLARAQGLALQADTEVTAVRPLGEGGYVVEAVRSRSWRRTRVSFKTEQVVLAGGVLGTVDLLLRMKRDPRGLPRLSDRVGSGVRTNSEAIIGVVSPRSDRDLSQGIAIGSMYEIDDRAHIEPVRYPAGSGFFRMLMAPHVTGTTALVRIRRLVATILRHPIALLRVYFVRDFARQSTMLLFMRAAEGTLRFTRSRFGGMTTTLEGEAPTASIPEATDLAHAVAKRLDGMPTSLVTETILNIPTTAHILGGCCMGDSPQNGVIDRDHRVFGYDGLYVMDGSAVSSNPGVNPSLTILAMAERALARLPVRSAAATRSAERVQV